MQTPFVFGRIASGEDFTDRERETAAISDNFRSLTNTIIIAPRRWGKSSLVEKAAKTAMAAEKDLRVCFVNLFNVRNEADFYAKWSNGIIKGTSSRREEMVKTVTESLKRLTPKVVISGDSLSDVSFSLDWDEVKESPDEVLDLAEQVAVKKGSRIIVCIDEFQNVAEFGDPLFFQRTLRAHWQTHQHVAYCLYGSKLHMMTKIFSDYDMPFYKFGDMRFLDKIDTESLVSFIVKRFKDTGKSISEPAAGLVVSLVENHPYYVQQLAQMAWLRTDKACDEEIVSNAHAALVGQLSMLFLNSVETLSQQQTCYLHAIVDGEKAITSTAAMKRYGITSATSASRSRKYLLDRDILDDIIGTLSLQDPVFAWWLKNVYFSAK